MSGSLVLAVVCSEGSTVAVRRNPKNTSKSVEDPMIMLCVAAHSGSVLQGDVTRGVNTLHLAAAAAECCDLEWRWRAEA